MPRGRRRAVGRVAFPASALEAVAGETRWEAAKAAGAECGLEDLRIIAELNQEPAALRLAGQIVERVRERQSLMALKSDGDAVLVARQRHQHFAVAFGQIRKIQRSGRIDGFEWRQGRLQTGDQPLRLVEIFVLESWSVVPIRGSVEVFPALNSAKFKTKRTKLFARPPPPASGRVTAQ